MDRHLWLIGMMGSGKTAAALALSGRWDAKWIDTDEEVTRVTGCSVAQLWSERGEKTFRKIEAAAVEQAALGEPAIVATGGGAVLDPTNAKQMRSTGTVVWLSASPAVLSCRVGVGTTRPLLAGVVSAERLGEILDIRRNVYADTAHAVIEVGSLEIDAVLDEIEMVWNGS